MKKHVSAGKYLTAALALGAFAFASTPPAFARNDMRATQSARQAYAYTHRGSGSQSREGQISAARSGAIHECNAKAAQFNYIVWQSAQFAAYGTCMAEHGQWFD